MMHDENVPGPVGNLVDPFKATKADSEISGRDLSDGRVGKLKWFYIWPDKFRDVWIWAVIFRKYMS